MVWRAVKQFSPFCPSLVSFINLPHVWFPAFIFVLTVWHRLTPLPFPNSGIQKCVVFMMKLIFSLSTWLVRSPLSLQTIYIYCVHTHRYIECSLPDHQEVALSASSWLLICYLPLVLLLHFAEYKEIVTFDVTHKTQLFCWTFCRKVLLLEYGHS